MEVPFRVVMDFIAEYLQQKHSVFYPQGDYAKKFVISRSYYSRFYAGKYVTKGNTTHPYPKGAAFSSIFMGICDLYEIDQDNYKTKAKALIYDLERNKNVSSKFIDTAEYVEAINEETVPADDKEFDGFLRNSKFCRFMETYFSLWGNEEYRDFQRFRTKTEGSVAPHQYYDVNIQTYMNQSLRDKSGADVLTVDLKERSCDFSFFEKNRVSIIKGPGGQGKTLFLYALHLIHGLTESAFDGVIIIPLVDLTLYRKAADNSGSDWIYEYIRLHYPDIDPLDTEKKYLFLLDGFNEYLASKNTQAVDKITEDVNRLIEQTAAAAEHRISVVITTRDDKTAQQMLTKRVEKKTFTLSGTSKAVYEKIRSICENNNIPFEGEEIGRLAETPLYALLLVGLKEEEFSCVKSRYTLLDMVYRSRADQRLGDDLHKSSYDKEMYLYLYYVYLPCAAYQTVMSDAGDNTYTFSKSDVRRFFSGLRDSYLDETLMETAAEKEKLSLVRRVPDIDAVLLRYFLDNESCDMIRIEKTGSVYRFSHEIWRDYLVAKFLNICLTALKENYTSKDPDDFMALTPSYNVGSNVAALFLQSFDLDSDPETNKNRFAAFFTLETKISIRSLFGVTCLLHTAFDINEYLKIDLPKGENNKNKCLDRILRPLASFLKATPQSVDKVRSNEKIKRYTCEILSKVAEFNRRDNKYVLLYAYVELAKKIDPESDIMLNQEAKMYLSCSECKATEEQRRADTMQVVEYPDPLKKMDIAALYNKGVELLEVAVGKGYHLSTNTAGVLKSTVAPVLLMNQSRINPDFCGAFRCYMQVIYGAGYVRRDIAYTVRQALNLLLKGYVRVCDDSTFDPENDRTDLSGLKLKVCSPLFSRSVNEKTLALAKQLVMKAEGQELAGLNYLRAAALLLDGRKADAEPYFKARFGTESTLMSDIRLKYEYGADDLDDRIRQQFRDLIDDVRKAGYGTYDRTHPAYWYIDARQLLLSYAQDEEAEQAQEFFLQLESDEKVNEIVTMIMDFLCR